MKNKIFAWSVLLTVILTVSCGSKSTSEKKETNPMSEFLGMFNGTASQVAIALEKYGSNESVIKNDMALYDLKEPKIMKQKGECYLVEFNLDIAVKIYEICWENNKIVKINDIGLK
jgi:hypothetical protein